MKNLKVSLKKVSRATRNYLTSPKFETQLDDALKLIGIKSMPFVKLNEGSRKSRIKKKAAVLGSAATLAVVSVTLTKLSPTAQKHVVTKIAKAALRGFGVVSRMG